MPVESGRRHIGTHELSAVVHLQSFESWKRNFWLGLMRVGV